MRRPTAGRVLMVMGAIVAFWRSAHALHWYREWLRWHMTDPSGAELYEINLWFELVFVTVGLAAAGAGAILARSREPHPRPGFVAVCRPSAEFELAMIKARLDATDIQYFVDNEFAGFRTVTIGQAVVMAEADRADEAAEIVRELRGEE